MHYSVKNTLKQYWSFVSAWCKIWAYILLFFLSANAGAQIHFGLNSNYRYLKGSEAASLPAFWITDEFNDSGWSTGTAPFRYGDGAGGTLLTDMQNNYSTLYLRTTFNAFSIDRIKTLNFSVDYDDGFVIWINGTVVMAQNAPVSLSPSSLATANHESGVPVVFSVDSADVDLYEGENLLCIQVFNVTLNSSDFYFDMGIGAELSLPEVSDSLKIIFNHDAGFYDTPFTLQITSPSSEYGILYTLDGSNPQTSSTATAGVSPVFVTVDPESTDGRAKTPVFIVRASLTVDGFSPSRPATRSFIFLDRVLTQSHPGGDWPVSAVNDQVIDLDMDPDVVNDPRYKTDMKVSLLDIPTISLVTDNEDMFNASTGIYVNAYGHGEQWERECSFELINPDLSPGFQINAGVRIRGGASRTGSNPKHAFRLFFRREYGPGKLVFPLFGNEGPGEFDKIDLRTEQNYSWSKDGDSHNTFLRDIFSRDLQRDMGQPYTRGRYYHLYLNGMYWGMFQTEERPDADYAETYFGDSDDDYDVIKVSVEGWPYYNEATDGTMAPWQDLWNRCIKGFRLNSDYFALEGKDQDGKPVKNTRVYVDIDNLIDYMLLIFYTGNVDAPVSAWNSNNMPNNYFAILNRKNRGQGFVFICHDSEHSMFVDPIYVSQGLYENRVTINDPVMSATGVIDFQPQWLHFKLSENAEYRLRFADRAARHFTSGGALTPAECIDRWKKRRDEINMAIIAESARWGDSKRADPRDRNDDWVPEVNDIINRYFPLRSAIVIDQLKAAGLYSSVAPVIIRSSGNELSGDNTFTGQMVITFQNPNTGGTIYYTTDGNDPRLIGGAVSPSARVATNYSSLDIASTTLIKARVLYGQTWSAVKEISLSRSAEDYSGLKVTEVHYHPADLIVSQDTVDGKDLEFIELKNTGINSVNISGVTIDTAVHYVVPSGTILPPKGFFVIASKPEEFYRYYGMIPCGNFSGNLSNSGEFVLLNNVHNNKILSFTYSDDYPWPESADGEGYSLVSASSMPQGDPDNYKYWKSSKRIGGSPFSDDEISTSVYEAGDDRQYGRLIVYPNPVYETFIIRIDGQGDDGYKVTITDLEGRPIMERKVLSNQEISLSGTGMAPGIYIITAEINGVRYRSRFVYLPRQ